MCVVAVKYFRKIGWVGVKNRDRNYQAKIKIIQSNRKGIQRLYIDDELTRYTEGLNEHGLCILSASLAVKDDEKELSAASPREEDYSSPDGKKIRNALLCKTPELAVESLIENELSGSTYVFNETDCYLIEAGFNVKKEKATKENPRKFIYEMIPIPKDQISVRTNHGILIKQLGYAQNSDDDYIRRSRKSSESRHRYASEELKSIRTPMDMLDALAKTPDSDPFMNPIRIGNTKKKDMVTTGQLLLVPKERTLHYRPIFSAVNFVYDKLNGETAKTFFEIISSRKLLGFKDYLSKTK